MLICEEEVVVLEDNGGNMGVVLLLAELAGFLRVIILNALALDHNEAYVDTLNLGDELVRGDGFRLGLADYVRD